MESSGLDFGNVDMFVVCLNSVRRKPVLLRVFMIHSCFTQAAVGEYNQSVDLRSSEQMLRKLCCSVVTRNMIFTKIATVQGTVSEPVLPPVGAMAL